MVIILLISVNIKTLIFIMLISVNIKILTANIFHKVISVAIKYFQGGLIKARQPLDNIG